MNQVKTRKTGIFSGSFNPIHIGHLALANYLCEYEGLDEIWFMPSAKPPHKNQDEIAEKEHRKRMVQFAIDKIPHFKISNIEYKRAGKTYTYDTLVELKKERDDAHFYFIMGGDSLAQFEQWYHPEKIVKLCTILAASRDEISYEQTKEYCKQLSERLDGDFRPLKIPAMSISYMKSENVSKRESELSDIVRSLWCVIFRCTGYMVILVL